MARERRSRAIAFSWTG